MATQQQCSTFLLDFSWIKPYSMHSFRLRYIVLGLLIYIQSAYCRTTCVSEFDDVPSRAYLANIIIEGTVEGKLSHGNPDLRYNASFTVKKVLKGSLPERRGKFLPVIVGTFGAQDPCGGEVVVGGKYVVFLRDLEDPNEPYYKLSGVPEPSDKKALRDVRKQVCKKCGKCYILFHHDFHALFFLSFIAEFM